ncbi:lytic murein transglycosylase [Labrys monachus]|uniref:Lytic murein transglycosylase n=1 Tax=Labrys monachus TaxID=217067 RepID=A0ABU0FPE1_9HYPH|nr:lytic murein transglycosylase [Labrys monachus]MDQ0396474.1 lytic murein transglycosylase [Labrys monachus]
MKPSIALVLAMLACSAPPAAAASFQSCLAAIGSRAVAAGVSPAVFERSTSGLQPDMTIIDLMNKQPEFRTPIWDYMAGLVDAQRIADGRRMLAKWGAVLGNVQRRYGVDPAVVVAVWGVESNFGENQGSYPLVQSLATLSCYGGRRHAYFQGEFINALKIIQRRDVDPAHLMGSWAGAFGNTQFMPSTFLRSAVDGDGDGRRDIVDSVPDALASTANYLAKAGWVPGSRWGYEVRLPSGFRPGLAGRGRKRPLAAWAAMGVRRVDGSPLPADNARAAILLPAGASGPAFVVFRNFDAIYSYNAAESYALAIAHLSDRIRGGGPFATPWPTDDPGLSRAQRRELQALLTRRGYDVGPADGAIGAKTVLAVKDMQRRLGLAVTGHPGLKILTALRGG